MYDSEKQMLREFFLLHAPEVRCHFCGRPIYTPSNPPTFGHRRHTKIHERCFTVHHEDENRDNNTRPNLKDAHPSCHRRYHNQKRKEENDNAEESQEVEEVEEGNEVVNPVPGE